MLAEIFDQLSAVRDWPSLPSSTTTTTTSSSTSTTTTKATIATGTKTSPAAARIAHFFTHALHVRSGKAFWTIVDTNIGKYSQKIAQQFNGVDADAFADVRSVLTTAITLVNSSHSDSSRVCLYVILEIFFAALKLLDEKHMRQKTTLEFDIIEMLIETLELSETAYAFQFLLAHIEWLYTKAQNHAYSKAKALELYNVHQKRKTNSSNAAAFGYASLFISNILTLHDPSGQINKTSKKTAAGGVAAAARPQDAGGAADDGVDWSAYESLWSLQRYFASPEIIAPPPPLQPPSAAASSASPTASAAPLPLSTIDDREFQAYKKHVDAVFRSIESISLPYFAVYAQAKRLVDPATRSNPDSSTANHKHHYESEIYGVRYATAPVAPNFSSFLFFSFLRFA